MSYVIIALGSNYLQTAHIEWASQRLEAILRDLRFSRKLWTEDIHGRGIFYMNRLVSGSTSLSPDELIAVLKTIEKDSGRTKDCVTIDIDLMQFYNQRYHINDWSRPYIQRIINDIL